MLVEQNCPSSFPSPNTEHYSLNSAQFCPVPIGVLSHKKCEASSLVAHVIFWGIFPLAMHEQHSIHLLFFGVIVDGPYDLHVKEFTSPMKISNSGAT